MNYLIIIQARMNSTRFPGKVLAPLCGKPLLAHLLERISRNHHGCDIVVATSADDSDIPIVQFCATNSILCHRGPLGHVAERFASCLKTYPAEAFVRLSGDSPLLDVELVDRAIALYRQQDYDLITNVRPRTFPRGQSVEMIRSSCFLEHVGNMQDVRDQEHVTRYFYQHATAFKLCCFESPDPSYADISLAVDTPADLVAIETIMQQHMERQLEDSWLEFATLRRRLSQNPRAFL